LNEESALYPENVTYDRIASTMLMLSNRNPEGFFLRVVVNKLRGICSNIVGALRANKSLIYVGAENGF